MNEVEKSFSTLSIKSELQKQNKKEENEETASKSHLREKFSEYQLKDAWKVVCAEYIQMPDFYTTLSKYEPELISENQVKVYVDNKTQLDQFRNKRSDIMRVLRTQLQNFQVEVEVQIKETEGSEKVYTATEKFEYLKEKNPLLDKLKKELNLEIRI